VGYTLVRLNQSLRKNPDLDKFLNITDVTFAVNTQYAPLVSVEVERSFSLYKMILTDKRHCFTKENIERMIIIQFNNNSESNVL